MMSNHRILVVSTFLLLTISSLLALPQSQKTIFVGQFFQLSFTKPTLVTGENNGKLPSWLMMRNEILQGIPTENDIGKHTVKIVTDHSQSYTVTVNVVEETETKCGNKDAFWIDAYNPSENTLVNRVDSYIDLLNEESDIDNETIRVYSWDYFKTLRIADDLTAEDIATGKYIVTGIASCENFDEAVEVLDTLLEKTEVEYDVIKMVKGRFSKSKYSSASSDSDEDLEEEIARTVEELRTTTDLVRTTRRISDNKPILLNRLPSYTCTRGEICELRVPAETFRDPEDGDTFKLKLSIIALDNAEIWMSTDTNGMIGVPMNTGEYSYRLEARDKSDQMASAAFSVIVKPSLPTNHKIKFELDIPNPQIMETNPHKRVMFLRAASRALKTPVEKFTIQEISQRDGKTIIEWSNNTLPYKMCDDEGLNKMSSKMIIKQKMRTKTEFIKSMGNQFYVRRATLLRLGNCNIEEITTTTAPTVQSVQKLDARVLMIGIVLLCAFLILAALIVYCACTKRNSTKKSTSSDFVSKGVPVVFPDEVEDHDPTDAGTPMLAREERPPLKVSQHENPLYKPPPPMASNSPRLGHSATSSHHKLSSPFIPP